MTNANQKELNCQEVVELVTDYLEQALVPETQAQFEEHIEELPWLRNLPGTGAANNYDVAKTVRAADISRNKARFTRGIPKLDAG